MTGCDTGGMDQVVSSVWDIEGILTEQQADEQTRTLPPGVTEAMVDAAHAVLRRDRLTAKRALYAALRAKADEKVFAIWDDSDEYGPDLRGLYATRKLAEEEIKRRGQKSTDWPLMIEEHEVQTEVASQPEGSDDARDALRAEVRVPLPYER